MQKQKKSNETTKQGSVSVQGEIKIFLMTELDQWTFKLHEMEDASELDCFSCSDAEFAEFASSVAEYKSGIDWSDREERSNFLTQLWTFCQQKQFAFPLTKKLTGMQDKLASQAV